MEASRTPMEMACTMLKQTGDDERGVKRQYICGRLNGFMRSSYHADRGDFVQDRMLVGQGTC